MDPIHPISIESPMQQPIAATPRIKPAGRDGAREQEEAGGGRRRRAPTPRRAPDTDSAADDGHPHIDVTA